MSLKNWFLLISTLFLLAACGGKTRVESDLGIRGAPDWVNEGTQAVSDAKGRLIQGVGSAPRIADRALQKSSADNRARAEVARILATYMDIVMDDYSSSSGDGQAELTQQITSTTQVMLRGARIIGSWRDQRSGDIYSFAELDLDRVKQTVKTVELLDAGFREFMLRNGDDIFDRVHRRVR